MDTSNIVIILLFIVPGIIAEKICAFIDVPSGKKRSDFGLLISGIALSLPIFLISMIYIFRDKRLANAMDYINALKYEVDPLEVIYTVAIVTLAWGILSANLLNALTWILNLLRKLCKKMETDRNSCWRKFLIDDYRIHYVEVIKDGKSYKGFLGPFSLPDEEREITLLNYKELQNDDEYDEKTGQYEYEKKFTKIIGTYIDLEKNIIVNDYDIDAFNKWLEEKKKKISVNKPEISKV